MIEDGDYVVTLRDGHDYRAERKEGRWHLVDGTGWSEPLDLHEITAVRPFKPSSLTTRNGF